MFNPYKTDTGTHNLVIRDETAKDKYGFVLSSIWNVQKSKMLLELVDDSIASGSFKRRGQGKEAGKQNLSLLNPDLVARLVKYYSNENDLVVAPFGSRGSIGIVSYFLGRNSISTDIVQEYVENAQERIENAKINVSNEQFIKFYCGDATKGSIDCSDGIENYVDNGLLKDEIADLVISCAPYHRQEVYKIVPNQLSNIIKYEDFLKAYKKAIENHYRILKYNSFCIMIVNDFRNDNIFYDFHTDTINICKECGFIMHDVIINTLSSASLKSIGTNEKRGSKIMAKMHEYILVFRKPTMDGSDYRVKHKPKLEE